VLTAAINNQFLWERANFDHQ